MFVAINRFRVKRGAEGAFEKVWLSRNSYLDRVPGLVPLGRWGKPHDLAGAAIFLACQTPRLTLLHNRSS